MPFKNLFCCTRTDANEQCRSIRQKNNQYGVGKRGSTLPSRPCLPPSAPPVPENVFTADNPILMNSAGPKLTAHFNFNRDELDCLNSKHLQARYTAITERIMRDLTGEGSLVPGDPSDLQELKDIKEILQQRKVKSSIESINSNTSYKLIN